MSTNITAPSSTGWLQRLRRSAIEPQALQQVALGVLPTLACDGLHLTLLRADGSGDALLVVEEAERTVQIPLSELAAEMTQAFVLPTPEGMAEALRWWVARRPVTDTAAASAGVAVLDWADGDQAAVGWSVVVRRDDLVLPWHPCPERYAHTLYRTRSAATGRSFSVPVELRVDGEVAVWSCSGSAVLSTAVLVDPGRMLRAATRAGLRLRHAHAVVSPGRPVAFADAGVAHRLVGESSEPAVLLPWRELADLPWI